MAGWMWTSCGGHLSFLPNGQNDIMRRTARLLSLMNTQWRIHERGLFLDQTEAQRAKKHVFETPPPLSQGLNDRAPFPPYLKVWAHHWNWQCTNAIKMNYSRTPLFRSPKGNGKKFEIAGFRNNWGSVKGKGKSKGIRSSFEIAGTSN